MSYQCVRELFFCGWGGVGGTSLKSPHLAIFSGEVCLLVMNIAYCLKSRSIFFLYCYFILEILGTFQVHDRCLTAFERFSRSPGSFDVTHS